MSDRCNVPDCRNDAAIVYLDHGICDGHWNELTADGVSSTKLRMVLGIEDATPIALEALMEQTNENETTTTAAEAATAAPTATRTASKGRTKKGAPTKAAKTPRQTKAKGTKPPKPAKPKKGRAPKEDLVVFACRVAEKERTAFHKATGPAGASRFARRLMVAFANEDESDFRSLLKEARELRG